MLKIGITGGIGCGKSYVCNIFERMGYPVYNADNRAKWLIQNNDRLIASINQIFGNEAYINGEYNRKYISERVFANSLLLSELNAAVHPVVADDFLKWASAKQKSKIVFLEAAILFESNFNQMLNAVVAVAAPIDLRVRRVITRDSTTVEQILSRINNQMNSDILVQKSDFVIKNDEQLLLIPQVVKVIDTLLTY